MKLSEKSKLTWKFLAMTLGPTAMMIAIYFVMNHILLRAMTGATKSQILAANLISLATGFVMCIAVTMFLAQRDSKSEPVVVEHRRSEYYPDRMY